MLDQRMFTSKLRSILSDNSCRRMIGGKTSGTLDNARLAGLFARRGVRGRQPVFALPESRSDKAYHVGLLIDASGSMAGDKMVAAFAAAHGIAVALKAAGASMSCASFNAAYKPLSVPRLLRGDLDLWRDYMADVCTSNESGQNYDATALELMRREVSPIDARRLIVVFSDGQPTSQYDDELREIVENHKSRHAWFDNQTVALPKVISRCESDGVAVVGVGIQTTTVTRLYKRRAIVNDLGSLYSSVLSEIAKFVRRGR